jgi:hypothetical protein
MFSPVDLALVRFSLSPQYTIDELRERYLELVKRFPPDSQPEEFRRIQLDYELLQDPMLQAAAVCYLDGTPDLKQIVERVVPKKSTLPKLPLLSLGN